MKCYSYKKTYCKVNMSRSLFLASMISGVKLKKAAPVEKKQAPVVGRDAALDAIRNHPGVAALRKVEKNRYELIFLPI